MDPLISVIMPAYNSENTIGRAIQSVLVQTYTKFELLVIDDGSIDNTVEVAESFAKADSRVILLKNAQNLGVAESRNLGCRKARGEYLSFLDSDDIWFKGKLEKQIRFMQNKDCDLSCTAYSFINASNEPSKNERAYMVPETISYKSLLKENVIGCSTVMLRAAALAGHEFDKAYAHEDYALWLNLAKSGKALCGLNEVLTGYAHGGRSSNKLKAGKNRWIIYRRSQKLSLVKSSYYMLFYIYNALKKYKSMSY